MIGFLLVSGLVIAAVLGFLMFSLKVNVLPIVAMALITMFGVSPLVYSVGSEIAKDSASTFNEYWNGFETAAVKDTRECTRDGSCRHEYDCDPYTVTVTKHRTVSDGKGGTKSESYQDTETRYHDCPYSKQETTYTVESTIGSFTLASNVMTGEPFRWGKNIPGGQQGDPANWTEAKKRIDAGKPGPVTSVNEYKNYILASQESLFSDFSDNIDALKAKNLLPVPSVGVHDLYHATKAYKVGDANVPLYGNYIKDLSYLNGAVGDDLHGDLHVVFVPADIEGGKDDYMNSLKAYWQAKEHGRNAISKNSIIVLIGASADGKTVEWAKATTGMPLGNEYLLTQIASDLKDKPMDENLLGRPSFNVQTEQVVSSDGVLEGILWGNNKFERVSMTANDVEDAGSGFSYLRDEMKPSGWAVFWMGVVNFFACAFVIVAGVLLIINNVLPRKLVRWQGSGMSYYSSHKSHIGMRNAVGRVKSYRRNY